VDGRGLLVYGVNSQPLAKGILGYDLGKLPQLENYLKQLGDQGWELVAVYQGYYFFKRPKQGD
jgi:hypothetical protein